MQNALVIPFRESGTRMHKKDHVLTHVKDPVVHGRVRRIMEAEKTQHALYDSFVLGRATLLQLAFLTESNANFPWEKFPLWTTTCTQCKIVALVFPGTGMLH